MKAIIQESKPRQSRKVILEAEVNGILRRKLYDPRRKELILVVQKKDSGVVRAFFSGRNGIYFYYFLQVGDWIEIQGHFRDKTQTKIKGLVLLTLDMEDDIMTQRREMALQAFNEVAGR